MNYAQIRNNDIANGEGIRVSLFVSGCYNNCPGCFNEKEKDFSYGEHFTEKTFEEIIKLVRNKTISGLTILGGDPLCQDIGGLLTLKMLCDSIRYMDDKTVWLYTGFIWENINPEIDDTRIKLQYELLSACDVVVDGPFVEHLSSGFLKWRGSSNQRIIDVQRTLAYNNKVQLYMEG